GKGTLSGGYPDELVHSALVAAVGPASDETRIYSGAPQGFEGGAKFALAILEQLEEGEVALADLSLTVSGRAKSVAAFDALQTLQRSAPPGLQIAALKVSPPIASPYVWTATFDGMTVRIVGNT